MKGQAVRVLDVVVLGPVLMWLASQRRPLPPGERATLWVIGAGTVLYNLSNYLEIAKQRGTDAATDT